jgi:hypothetical protein
MGEVDPAAVSGVWAMAPEQSVIIAKLAIAFAMQQDCVRDRREDVKTDIAKLQVETPNRQGRASQKARGLFDGQDLSEPRLVVAAARAKNKKRRSSDDDFVHQPEGEVAASAGRA